MGEVNGWVTHTALAIRDEDELEVAASLLDAALRRAKAEVWRDMQYWVRNETIDAMRKYIDARIAELEADARAAQIEADYE